jgi:virginiamycin B lyase
MRNDPCRLLGLARMLLVAILVFGSSIVAAAQTIVEYPLPPGSSGPGAITAGPDGALWFTLSGTNQIGQVTTAGVFTVYSIPTANSGPSAITAGTDGALWFTEAGSRTRRAGK